MRAASIEWAEARANILKVAETYAKELGRSSRNQLNQTDSARVQPTGGKLRAHNLRARDRSISMEVSVTPSRDEIKQPERPKLRDVMGPGLITGASDDDPSGIATYSQAGAQFGYSMGWTLLFTYPLMCAIQLISAQIGRVTGRGLAGNMRRHYPAPLLYLLVGLLVVANTINLGADLGAMAAALRLLIDGPMLIYVAGFAVVIVLLEVFMRYSRYASVLRWLTLSLFAYVATVFVVGVPWLTVARNLVLPHISPSGDYLTVVVAVFGTTISPYLFFWQAGEEVEDQKEDPKAKPLMEATQQRRGRWPACSWTRSSAWASPTSSRCSSC